jgi:hypothetical protein
MVHLKYKVYKMSITSEHYKEFENLNWKAFFNYLFRKQYLKIRNNNNNMLLSKTSSEEVKPRYLELG